MPKITPSTPMTDACYSRTFDAEIDIVTDNEILVRGRLQDQALTLDYAWNVRTPEYQVVAATAEQSHADPAEFDPELCARQAGVAGIRIGRGFSKNFLNALGDLPGKDAHLFLAIEMARIAQQVYQFPPEFEAQFPAIGNPAKLSWQKDRAYMSDLANSCYTYRDETEALFAEREVRAGFDPELYTPRPGDKRVFWRKKQLSISRQEAGFACESAMEDRIHDIRIAFDIDETGLVSNAQSRGLRLPYHGICEDAQLRTEGLKGLRVGSGYILQFADRIGGARGCTHLFDLATDVLRLFRFQPSDF
jgi:hypothetical protein